MIRIKRVYHACAPDDGTRFLVDRLWPRGAKRAKLGSDVWLKDVAPSDALRRWFGHDPARWDEFCRRYSAELDGNPEAWRPLPDGTRHLVAIMKIVRDEVHTLFEEIVAGKAPADRVWTGLDITDTHFVRREEGGVPASRGVDGVREAHRTGNGGAVRSF